MGKGCWQYYKSVAFLFLKSDYLVAVKNIFLSLMVLLMITPSLACAMPVCMNEIKENGVVTKPCSDHNDASETKEGSVGSVKFMLDCMGVDLQKADAVSFEKANIQLDPIHHPFINNAVLSQNIFESGAIIRGPPPDRGEYKQTYQSIILTTQRLRI